MSHHEYKFILIHSYNVSLRCVTVVFVHGKCKVILSQIDNTIIQTELTVHVNVKIFSEPWSFFLQDEQTGVPGTLLFTCVARSCGNHCLPYICCAATSVSVHSLQE